MNTESMTVILFHNPKVIASLAKNVTTYRDTESV